MKKKYFILIAMLAFLPLLFPVIVQSQNNEAPSSHKLILSEKEYFETRGVNMLVFSNWYNGLFSDSKMSGIELIHHEVRTATNGDVRLSPTPTQWDPIPTFVDRKVDMVSQSISANLKYPEFNFNYTIKAVPEGDGILISVNLEKPLPEELVGKAGFNFEFLPATYLRKHT